MTFYRNNDINIELGFRVTFRNPFQDKTLSGEQLYDLRRDCGTV